MSFLRLREELLALFSLGVAEPFPEPAFNELALQVLRFQAEANPAYRGFMARRGVEADAVSRWEDIPFLPARAFKSVALVSGDPGDFERVFRTSGTTRGRQMRGEHFVRDLALYRESLLPNFQAHLLPEGVPMPILCLLPSPDALPDSSLSFMMGEVARAFGTGLDGAVDMDGPMACGGGGVGSAGGYGGGFFVHPEHGLDIRGFREALAKAGPGPVLLAGTAFAFVQWLELAEEEGWRVSLPEGSRVMETGGYKGRTRALSREDFYRRLIGAFGIPGGHIVNEYGMTELLSQFYEPVLAREGRDGESSGEGEGESDPGAQGIRGRNGAGVGTGRFHRGPPWVRTRVLDPRTLEEVPEGELGLLAHLDLANLGSVAGILTEDLGRRVPGGFQLVGRSRGAEPRGCSLALEAFLAALEEGS